MKGATFVYALVIICAASGSLSFAVAADPAGCFEELAQSYSWDDQGLYWRSQKNTCPGEPAPSAWQERKVGGHIEIKASGKDASVIEETYGWVPHADTPPGQCPVAYKTVTRRTRIASGGMLYDTQQTDNKPPISSQRPLHGNQQIPGSGVSVVPPVDSPDFKQLGADTIAGQPCQRLISTSKAPDAAITTLCIYVAPRSCSLAHYLKPLEQKTVAPDGTIAVLGKTTELRVGKLGEVLPKNSIVAP